MCHTLRVLPQSDVPMTSIAYLENPTPQIIRNALKSSPTTDGSIITSRSGEQAK